LDDDRRVVATSSILAPASRKAAVYDLYSQTAQQWKRWMYPTIRGAVATGILLDK